jgi:hypothetical protein
MPGLTAQPPVTLARDPGRPWPRWNVRVTAVFGPVLILTGLVGLAFPDLEGPMSHAVPYDVFHIAFGLLAVGIALGRQSSMAALFNLGFGLIDLYQAVAGVAGLFPAALFELRPGDHVVHVVLGFALFACGLAGLRRRA